MIFRLSPRTLQRQSTCRATKLAARPAHANRRGAILVCVLTCLLVAMAMVMTAVHMSLRARRECRVAHQLRQTDLLAEAGKMRALSQLEEGGDYPGETWRPTVPSDRFGHATVRIDVRRTTNAALVTVTATTQLQVNSTADATIPSTSTTQDPAYLNPGVIQRTLTFSHRISNPSEVE